MCLSAQRSNCVYNSNCRSRCLEGVAFMIDAVATVCLFVNDQDKAKNLYVNKLDFEVRSDQPMGESRWLAVAPKGAVTEIILYKVDQNWQHHRQIAGKSQAT